MTCLPEKSAVTKESTRILNKHQRTMTGVSFAKKGVPELLREIDFCLSPLTSSLGLGLPSVDVNFSRALIKRFSTGFGILTPAAQLYATSLYSSLLIRGPTHYLVSFGVGSEI